MGACGRRQSQEENGGWKRKSEFQLQALEGFFAEEKYPSRKAMEEYGTYLGLTYNQVRVWFSEKRRRTCKRSRFRKNEKKTNNSLQETVDVESIPFEVGVADGVSSKKGGKVGCGRVLRSSSAGRVLNGRSPYTRVRALLSQEHILTRVFRKDGPPLGIEFDSIPARGFDCSTRFLEHSPISKEIKIASNKQKILKLSDNILHGTNSCEASRRRHGMGKGLMTVWNSTNPGGGFPVGLNSSDRRVAAKLLSSEKYKRTTSGQSNKRSVSKRAKTHLVQCQATKVKCDKINERRQCREKRNKVLYGRNKVRNVTQRLPTVGCGLLCSDLNSQGQLYETSGLIDDEELELSELQAGPTRFRCSAHLTLNGRNDCPLCKDMLDEFPPPSVCLKHPICSKPWISSPNLVKKLFKVFQFLYTYADRIDVGYFTLYELAEGFQEKDSVLLGKIHATLLNVLLSIVHVGISSGIPRPSKDCRFCGFMHTVGQRDSLVAFWIKSLNALTWTEILRQVSIAAGFGSVEHFTWESVNKEGSDMDKYGLRPCTLKHALFCILFEQGSRALKVSDLARASQIIALGIPGCYEELECLVSSTLSSDITLFEKIGTSAFRLRTGLTLKEVEKPDSVIDDSGSIDSSHLSSNSDNSSDECEFDLQLDSSSHCQPTASCQGSLKRNRKRTRNCVEIDESFSGEAWFMGLMEGTYSDLSIDEKLDALIALVDLTSSALSLGIDETTTEPAIISDRASGGKIKKVCLPVPDNSASLISRDLLEWFQPSQLVEFAKNCKLEKSRSHQHSLQAINIGSDRRYNRYWLFLGPCEKSDPGHRRVYFESSEDGNWKVIDTKQALSSLMLALDCRGTREFHLFASLEKRERFLYNSMTEYLDSETGNVEARPNCSQDSDVSSGHGCSLISDVENSLVSVEGAETHADSPCFLETDTGRNCADKKSRSDQLEVLDKWIWTSFFRSLNAVKQKKKSYQDSLACCEQCRDLFWRDEKHCKMCHTTFELDFDIEEKYAIHIASCSESTEFCLSHKVLSSQLQALKAAIYAIEAVIPEKALVGWSNSSHNLWGKRLRRTSSLSEVLLVVKDFVAAIREDWLYECAFSLGLDFLDDVVVDFQTMPHTVAAVALWMVKLDILIAPYIESNNAVPILTESKRLRT